MQSLAKFFTFSSNQKITSKTILSLFILLVIFLLPQAVLAQVDFGLQYGTSLGLGTRDIRETIARIIKIALGVLGIIVTLIIIYGGYIWMTAGGNAQKIDLAKKILLNGVIGLIIIVLAYAITVWLFNTLIKATTGGSGGNCTVGTVSADGCYSCVSPGVWSWNGSCTLPGSAFIIRDVQTTHNGNDPKQDVYLCSSVQSVFNNVVDPQSVTNATSSGQLYVRNNNSGQVFDGYWQTAGNAVVFKHDQFFDPNTSYSIYYPRQGNSTPLQDLSALTLTGCDVGVGCNQQSTYLVWDFTTGTDNDTESPYITSSYPIFDQTDPAYPDRNVSLWPIFRVKFSEPIDATTVITGTSTPITGNVILEELDGQGGQVVYTFSNNNLEARVYESGFNFYLLDYLQLKPFTWYRITVANIEDLCGNPMQNPVVWEFQTNDQAPGVASYYPTGDNVCLDTRVSITFNTSMYYQEVAITITDENGNLFGSAVMNPSLLNPPGPPYQVRGNGGTWQVVDDNDISTGFKTFEFVPDNSFSANTRYYVDVTTDLVIDTNGTTLGQQWDFNVSTPETCACAPYITSLSPSEGQAGQCLTVKGYCFLGTSNNPATPSLTIGGLPAPIHSSSTDYLTSTVPDSLGLGTAMAEVTLTYDDPNLGSLVSNQSPFNVNQPGAYDGPCLYSISPGKGCGYTSSQAGTAVTLTGVRLGDDPAPPVSNYATVNDNVTFTAGGGTVWAEAGAFTLWSPEKIKTEVPTGATDGDVFVTTNGRQSNALPFDISCGVGQPCSNDLFACVPDSNNCSPGLVCGANSCVCELPNGSGSTSGSFKVSDYWPNCDTACLNSEVGARFSQALDQSSVNDNSVDILPCNDSACTIFGSEPSFTISFNSDSTEFYSYPSLIAATSYRVILDDSIVNASGSPISNLNYDRDGDGVNDSFSWTFSTGSNNCQVTEVETIPDPINFSALNQTKQINAKAKSDKQCGSNNYVNPWAYNWSWASSDTNIASVTNDDSDGDNLVDPVQEVTAKLDGTANITATESSSSLSDYSVVQVNSGSSSNYPPPSIISTIPVDNATGICRNAIVEVTFDQLMNKNTISTSTFSLTPAARGTVYSFDVREGVDNCLNSFNGEGCTVARFYPTEPLAASQLYSVTVSSKVQSIYGLNMTSDVTWSFTTGDDICLLDEVDVTPDYYLFTKAQEQYTYVATAYTNNNGQREPIAPMAGLYSWTWGWSEDDPDNAIELLAPTTTNDQVIQANNKNGLAEVEATATINEDTHNNPSTVGRSVSGLAEAEVWLCENPWPDPAPMQDNDFGFQMRYCRGNSGEELLLPLSDPQQSILTTPTDDDPDLKREYFFTYVSGSSAPGGGSSPAGGGSSVKFYISYSSLSDFVKLSWLKVKNFVKGLWQRQAVAQVPEDVIGLRIYENPERLSPYAWYQQRPFPKGSPREFEVDGFPAMQDGNSVYIMGPKNGSTIETYIYVLSYNDLSSPENINIFNQLIDNFRFFTFTADEKKAVRRDLIRLADASTIKEAIDTYKEATGFYPSLSSGTYISGMTNSRWPSWQSTLGNALGRSLAIDPINEFAGSCEQSGSACFTDNDCSAGEKCVSECDPNYDTETCWNENTQEFFCPSGSSIYQYRLYGVNDYRLGIYLEMPGKWGSLPRNIELVDAFCNSSTYSSSGFCGDGIVQPSLGEECEIGQQVDACQVEFGDYAWHSPQMVDCSNNCTFDTTNVDITDCDGYCGDGVANMYEVCDGTDGTIPNSTCLSDCSNYVCNPGYGLIDGQCQPVWCDPNANRSCSVPGGTGILNNCDLDTLQWTGPCYVVDCNPGYHIENNECVPDSPNVTITSPADNSSGGSSVTVYYDISEGGTVDHSVDGDIVYTTGNNAGSYSYTFRDLSPGPHELKVTLSNSNGTFSDSITYTYTAPASVSILEPLDNECVTNQVTIKYEVNQGGNLEFLVDGSVIGGANNQSSGVHYYTYPPVSNTTHQFGVNFDGIYGGSDSDVKTYNVGDGIEAPSALGANYSPVKVTLTWVDNADNEDGFVIERKLESATSWQEIASIGPSTTPATSTVTYVDNTVQTKESYFYRVKAVNQCWSSDYSNIAFVYTDSNSSPPSGGCKNVGETCGSSVECCEGLTCQYGSNVCKNPPSGGSGNSSGGGSGNTGIKAP